MGGTTQTSGGGEGPHAPPPFGGGPIAKVINSQSANVDVGSLPLTRNEQWILTANVRVAGHIRRAPGLARLLLGTYEDVQTHSHARVLLHCQAVQDC